MNANDIRTLYAYNRWANQRMFSVLEKLSAEQFMATEPSSFPSIWESVFHILGAEWLWLKRWKGESPRARGPIDRLSASTWDTVIPDGVPAIRELSTFSAIRQFAESIERERQEYLGTLTDEKVSADLHFSDMSGNPYSEPLAHLLQHVVNHGTYHRGQVTTLLRQVGGETVALDMVYFFREQGAR